MRNPTACYDPHSPSQILVVEDIYAFVFSILCLRVRAEDSRREEGRSFGSYPSCHARLLFCLLYTTYREIGPQQLDVYSECLDCLDPVPR